METPDYLRRINETDGEYNLRMKEYYSGTPSEAMYFGGDRGTVLDLTGNSTVGGRLASTVSDAINSDGDLVNDVINARIDTAAKNILGAFTFGASGALQIGTYVNGVSGDIRISPSGIVARSSAGANTITIDGTTGAVTMVGTITAAAGSIGGWTISSTALYLDGATDAVSSGMASADYPFYAGKKYADRATAPFRVTPAGAVTATSATITGAITTGTGSSLDGIYLVATSVSSAAVNVALRGWTFTGAFSASDYRVVAWAAGTFTASDGTAYSIAGGNTGNMSALNYIYLDIAVSTTAFQTTTTAATAIGNGKVLIAVAQNNSDTASRATYQVFGGSGGELLSVANLAANSASTNEFVSNSAQLANLVVTNAKINDLAANKITAGTITSKSITLAVSEGSGDVEMRAGIATGDFANTGAANGFIFGIDDSDSNKVKFYFGNATRNVAFDGTDLTVNGYALSTDLRFGGDGSDGALTITSGTTTIDVGGATIYTKNYSSISITSTGALAFTNKASTGTIVLLRAQSGGNGFTLTSTANPGISLVGMGANGGTGGENHYIAGSKGGGGGGGGGAAGAGNNGSSNSGKADENGTDGTNPTQWLARYYALKGTGGVAGGVAGSGGASAQATDSSIESYTAKYYAVIGAGGGGGASGMGEGGGDGGAGGGALIIECGASYNFGASSYISVSGADANPYMRNHAGQGGGGGAGSIRVTYCTLTANSGTYTVAGGLKGQGGGTGAAGGDGGLGYYRVSKNIDY